MEERLRKFAYLVDAGSFTKASRELHISQPALSAAINKLERELKAQLSVHGTRPLKLTRAGKLAYDSAKELGMVSSNLATRLAELSDELPALRIGMIDSVASILFDSAHSVDELERQAKLSIVVNNSRYLADVVARDEVDIAFITDKPVRTSSAFITESVTREAFVAICHPLDVESVQRSIARGELPNFVSYDQASATRRIINEELRSYNIETYPSFYSSSPEVALQLVRLRKGVAALPYLLVKKYISGNEVSLIGVEQPIIIERPISVIRRRGKLPIAATHTAINLVSQLFDKQWTELQAASIRWRISPSG